MDELNPLLDLNRELMALRRAQLIVNSSPTSSMADKRRISDRVMALMAEHNLLPAVEDQESTEAHVMF